MTSFKTRVIGAVILVSLAVIFVPMLFKSPSAPPPQRAVQDRAETGERPLRDQAVESRNDAKFSQRLEVPDEPEIPEFTIEKPVEPELREQTMAVDVGDIDAMPASGEAADESPAKPVEPAPKPAAKPLEKPAASAAAVGEKPRFGEAWTVQIGAFSDRGRAQKISAELQKSGTAAYLQDIKTSGGVEMVRVYAGPMLARESAEKLKSTLDSRYGVNSLIMRYRPVQP